MKFKKTKGEACKRVTIVDNDSHVLDVETREDGGPGLFVFVDGNGVELTPKKALKLAWAIINELDPIKGIDG